MKSITLLHNEQFAGGNLLLDDYLEQVSAWVGVYLGYQLGFYQTLQGSPPLTAYEIAIWTNSVEVFVSKWLEQQAAAGILEIADPTVEGAGRRFHLLPARLPEPKIKSTAKHSWPQMEDKYRFR